MAPLELSSALRDDHTVISIRGELDALSREQFTAYLDALIAKHGTKIVLDLSELEFLDTAALSTIVAYWKRLSAGGGTLALAGAQYATARVLWITGLAQRLPLFDNVDAALAAAPPDPAPR